MTKFEDNLPKGISKKLYLRYGRTINYIHYNTDNVSYVKSLELRAKSDYKFHPTPQQVYSAMIDYYEGKSDINDFCKKLNSDNYSSINIWLNLAVEKKKDKLIVYVNPNGLVYHEMEYFFRGIINVCSEYTKAPDFNCQKEEKFNLNANFLEKWTEYLIGKPLNKLPEKIYDKLYGHSKDYNFEFPSIKLLYPISSWRDSSEGKIFPLAYSGHFNRVMDISKAHSLGVDNLISLTK